MFTMLSSKCDSVNYPFIVLLPSFLAGSIAAAAGVDFLLDGGRWFPCPLQNLVIVLWFASQPSPSSSSAWNESRSYTI